MTVTGNRAKPLKLGKEWSRRYPTEPGLYWLTMWDYTHDSTGWVEPVVVHLYMFAGILMAKVVCFQTITKHPRVNVGSEYQLDRSHGCGWSNIPGAPPILMLL